MILRGLTFSALILIVVVAGSGAVAAQQVVGAVGAANASPTGRAPGQAVRMLTSGSDIFFKDHIATKRGGSAQLTFLDRSTLNVGENSDIVVDEFVYRPGGANTMSATLVKGMVRFVGGSISHEEGVTVKTPVATIGIRGGIATIGYLKATEAQNMLADAPPGFHGGAIIVSSYGTLTVHNGAGEVVISRPGFAVFVGSASEAMAAPVRLDMASAEAMLKTLTSKSGQEGGASAKAVKAGIAVAPMIAVPVSVAQPRTVDPLAFTSVFSASNRFAKDKSQSQRTSQLRQQIVNAQSAVTISPVPPAIFPTSPPPVTPAPTQPPTASPTPAPTQPPTASPTPAPTPPQHHGGDGDDDDDD